MMIHPNHFSYSLDRALVSVLPLLVLLSARETTLVYAQASCSAAQSIVSPFSVSDTIANVNSDFVDTKEFCGASALDSDFPQGHWFSYTPSESIMARVALLGDSSNAPYLVIYKGTCDSLTCISDFSFIEETVLEATAGEQYLIFLYRPNDWTESYELVLEEYEIPANDKMAGAVAITQDDLPFQGDFTLDGALVDFGEDACALDGNYGVWFTYTTNVPAELIVLDASLRGSPFNRNVIGVQAQVGDTFACIAMGNDFDRSVEWTAEANVQYYILMGDRWPQTEGAFELTVQSRGPVQVPTAPTNPEPAPESPPVAAPATNVEGSAPVSSPVSAPTASSNEGPQGTPPTSETGRLDVGLGAQLAFWIGCLLLAY